ncbi:MAG: hypothetical protein HY520_04620 [Candidatus Aenigmarchaeota archaeon]|nr:hypothetical protein [Candidatus Aenigmarchaeota archaeon]
MAAARRAGEFQLSLGFIISIVFAVVFLSLAITWLQGLLGGVVSLTDDLSVNARSELRKTFSETQAHFGIWPPEYTLAPGRGINTLASIENDDPQAQANIFVINVIPSSASSGVRALRCTQGDFCQDLREEMLTWATFADSATTIQYLSIEDYFVRIEPKSPPPGTYIYTVVACSDKQGVTLSENCNGASQDWGSEQIIIQVAS